MPVQLILGGTNNAVELKTPPGLTWTAVGSSTATCQQLTGPIPNPAKGQNTYAYTFECTVTQWGSTQIKFDGATVQSGV